jgi:hypothetical protein
LLQYNLKYRIFLERGKSHGLGTKNGSKVLFDH